MGDLPELHVERHGRGAPVLLLHGFAGSARNFRPQARALRDRHAVWLYDARGHARSDAPDDAAAYDAAAFEADLERVLAPAGAERAVIGGLSMGAAVALGFAQRHPERVRGLVLASFPPGGKQAHAEGFAAAIEREGLDAAGARFVWGPESGLDERGAALVRQGFLEHAPHALAHILRGYLAKLPAARERAAQLAGFEVPTLLVAGATDGPCVEAMQALSEALPHATRVVIPDAGHVVNLAQPRAFDAALEKFLAELPS